MTSRIAYIMAPNMHAATEFAQSQGWKRLGAMRFTNNERQDIRMATSPGELQTHEFPTDVYREWHFRELFEEGDKGWKWDKTMHDELSRLVEDGHVSLANTVPEPPHA